MIFRENFLTLNHHKLIFVNGKSVSVMTGFSSFLHQPKLIWLAVLSILDISILLVPLEILSHYSDIDVTHWLKDDVQWTTDKVFSEKLMV